MNSIQIAIIGYGAMGKQIETIAKQRGHSVVAIISPNEEQATSPTLTKESLNNADIAIDFSLPETILRNIEIVLQTDTKLVVGTTGWYDKKDEIQEMVEKQKTGFLWSSNFSLGVQLYFKMIESASRMINNADEYDIWAHELHHKNKKDSPSGTAKTLEEILLKNIERKTSVVEETLQRTPKDSEIHFSSTRGGAVNFQHTIGFDSPEDTITIVHNARNRDGYAKGAVQAAEWLHTKTGFFSFEDCVSQMITPK